MAESESPYEVRLAPAAVRQLRKLSATDAKRVRAALGHLAESTSPGARGGKSLKRIKGRRDSFLRLRVGQLRVMFDRLEEERVLLVLGIVNRRDLERWLRGQ